MKPSLRNIKTRGRLSVEDQAAQWLALREFGMSAEEQAEFSRWLLADPRHAGAAGRIEAAWRVMRRPSFTRQTEAVEEGVERIVRRRSRRRALGLSAAGLAAAALILLTVFPRQSFDPASAPAAAGSVRIRPQRQTLPDGSVADLNAGSEIAVHFTPAVRDVRLVRGEAHFSVTKNPLRPFVVTAGKVSVRAVGTEFDVRIDPKLVDVLVTEGKVSVSRFQGPSDRSEGGVAGDPVLLAAGHRLTIREGAVTEAQPVQVADMRRALAWRTHRVEFTNMRLGEVVERFNRENSQHLVLANPALEDIRISGIFWADDPEGFSRLIEASAGLKAVRAADSQILLQAP